MKSMLLIQNQPTQLDREVASLLKVLAQVENMAQSLEVRARMTKEQ